MYLPHLKEVEYNNKWMERKRLALKKVLVKAIDFAGPEYVLDVLAEARADWSSADFETANLQREYVVETIQDAAARCRHISDVRFAIEGCAGRSPTRQIFGNMVDNV